jgi:hypothetical protein
MDRLVIETILTDVDEVTLINSESSIPSICLGFDAGNIEQAKHAFAALKKLTAYKEVSLVICETLVSGIYDLEIVTDALDEPVRICNKVVEHETLSGIRAIMDQQPELLLAVKGAEDETGLKISKATYKEHQV